MHPLTCLISHKCLPGSRDVRCVWDSTSVGRATVSALDAAGVSAVIDPFGPGVAVGARVDEIAFESLLFVFSRESAGSAWCEREVAAARRRYVPVFAIRVDGTPLTPYLLERVVPLVSEPVHDQARSELAALATSIRARATVWGALRVLERSNSADAQRVAAEWLEHSGERDALAEMLAFADHVWPGEIDATARCAMVRAIGHTDSFGACDVLLQWKDELEGNRGPILEAVEVSSILRVIEEVRRRVGCGG